MGGAIRMEAYAKLLTRLVEIRAALQNCKDKEVRRELWLEYQKICWAFAISLEKDWGGVWAVRWWRGK